MGPCLCAETVQGQGQGKGGISLGVEGVNGCICRGRQTSPCRVTAKAGKASGGGGGANSGGGTSGGGGSDSGIMGWR